MKKKQRRLQEKINKTKSWFFKKINRQTVSQTRKEKREKKKTTKFEMKMEKSQQTTWKYKGL